MNSTDKGLDKLPVIEEILTTFSTPTLLTKMETTTEELLSKHIMDTVIAAEVNMTSGVGTLYDAIVNATNKSTEIVISRGVEMNLTNSLCYWYLPTINQTPKALGNTGIALWVLGFVITFALMVMFIKQAHFIYKTAHKSFRRHLYSITSIYMVMALMTSIGSGIPRAHAVCSAIKDVYMAIGIGHFVDITLAMYGGENVMAFYLRDSVINMRVLLFFKCCFCIPRCKVTKTSVAVLKWMVWQMKWSQAIYYLLRLVWRRSQENTLGIVPQNSSFIYAHVLNVASFVSGVFSLLLISNLVREDLQVKYNYTIKAKTVRFTILATKLQRLLFEILEAFDVYPCFPPYVSKKFYKNVLKDFIYLVEVLVLGTVTFFMYTKRGEFEQGNSSIINNKMLQMTNDLGGFTDEPNAIELQPENGQEAPKTEATEK